MHHRLICLTLTGNCVSKQHYKDSQSEHQKVRKTPELWLSTQLKFSLHVCKHYGSQWHHLLFFTSPFLLSVLRTGDEKVLIGFQHIICSLLSLHTLMAFFHSKKRTRFQNAAPMATGIGSG